MEWRQSNVIINSFIYWYDTHFQVANVFSCRCAMTVEPAGDNVCQLRIDMLDFALAPPNGDGICNTDVISITGSATNVPLLCGENSGQHLIVDFAGTNPITIAIKTTSSYTFGRHWNIRVAQINCNSEYRGKHLLCVICNFSLS